MASRPTDCQAMVGCSFSAFVMMPIRARAGCNKNREAQLNPAWRHGSELIKDQIEKNGG